MSDLIEVRSLEVGPLQANCYLLKCGEDGSAAIIDPGDEARRLESAVREAGLKPEAILLTHGHIDHANAAGALKESFGCPIYIHAADRQIVESGESPVLWGLVRNHCSVDREVADADEITIGKTRIGVLHAPGHTGGSVCYRVGSLLFTGDVLFRGSIGRTDLPGGSDAEMMQTLKTRISVLDGQTQVYPGHGPETTIEHEKKFNPFL
jgi:glyoxylase-like metal-dependent hydrolase (beta-lactamase superfamily II)